MNVYILKSFKYEYSKPMMKLTQNRLEECCDGLPWIGWNKWMLILHSCENWRQIVRQLS